MIKIRVESMDRYYIKILMNQIESDILSRQFIVDDDIVTIIDSHITVGTKDDMSYIELIVKDKMNIVLIPILADKSIVNQYKSDKEIFITITQYDNSKIRDIGNMIYDQYIGHKDYIDNKVILNIDHKNIKIWISEKSNKIPLLMYTKFYPSDYK